MITPIGASAGAGAPPVYIALTARAEKVRFTEYGATKLTLRELITRLLSDALKSATEPSEIQIQSNNVSINRKRQQKQSHAAGHHLRIAFRYGDVPMPYRCRCRKFFSRTTGAMPVKTKISDLKLVVAGHLLAAHYPNVTSAQLAD